MTDIVQDICGEKGSIQGEETTWADDKEQGQSWEVEKPSGTARRWRWGWERMGDHYRVGLDREGKYRKDKKARGAITSARYYTDGPTADRQGKREKEKTKRVCRCRQVFELTGMSIQAAAGIVRRPDIQPIFDRLKKQKGEEGCT